MAATDILVDVGDLADIGTGSNSLQNMTFPTAGTVQVAFGLYVFQTSGANRLESQCSIRLIRSGATVANSDRKSSAYVRGTGSADRGYITGIATYVVEAGDSVELIFTEGFTTAIVATVGGTGSFIQANEVLGATTVDVNVEVEGGGGGGGHTLPDDTGLLPDPTGVNEVGLRNGRLYTSQYGINAGHGDLVTWPQFVGDSHYNGEKDNIGDIEHMTGFVNGDYYYNRYLQHFRIYIINTVLNGWFNHPGFLLSIGHFSNKVHATAALMNKLHDDDATQASIDAGTTTFNYIADWQGHVYQASAVTLETEDEIVLEWGNPFPSVKIPNEEVIFWGKGQTEANPDTLVDRTAELHSTGTTSNFRRGRLLFVGAAPDEQRFGGSNLGITALTGAEMADADLILAETTVADYSGIKLPIGVYDMNFKLYSQL